MRTPREALQPEHLASADVWEALLEEMPMTALVRNLATMTRVGVLGPGSQATKRVVAQLGDGDRIRRARLHPIALLVALRTYAAGRGVRGRNTWVAVREIVDALDAAFYTAFGNVERRASARCSHSTCRARWPAARSPARRACRRATRRPHWRS